MGLQSKLFRGDAKLEAAAISDPAHIMLGASGPHVSKIQTALISLDGATISPDELQRRFYGASTAAAVLAYKQKREIINKNYQEHADNIVGKMTMASLDREMLKREALPHAPVRIKPLSYWRVRPPRSPALLALLHRSRPLGLNFAIGSGVIGALHFNPGKVLVVPRNSTGTFEVTDGAGGDVTNFDTDIVEISSFLGWAPGLPKGKVVIMDSPETFHVKSGNKLGEAQVRALSPAGDWADLIIVVNKPFPGPPPFHTVKPHNHTPSGQWSKIQANPNSGGLVNSICSGSDDPQKVMGSAKLFMAKAPLAVEHLDWYLSNGKGNDFVEDLNILRWLNQDSHIRNRLKIEIFPIGKKRRAQGHFTFDRNDFDTAKTENFALSFGSIDRVDFVVDFSDDTVRVWFQDRYEFHPFYPGLYNAEPGDFVRGDNCVHAAAVEMKSRGAMDYWMKGEATVPLSLITKP